MYSKHVAKETAKVLQSYLTYQAVRTIISQLRETNPTQAIWLSNYSDRHKIQDGEGYLNGLISEDKELVLRIMTVREHLAEAVLDFMPEMVKVGISKANIEHRRHLLERLTQSQSQSQTSNSTTNSEMSNSELDSNDSSD